MTTTLALVLAMGATADPGTPRLRLKAMLRQVLQVLQVLRRRHRRHHLNHLNRLPKINRLSRLLKANRLSRLPRVSRHPPQHQLRHPLRHPFQRLLLQETRLRQSRLHLHPTRPARPDSQRQTCCLFFRASSTHCPRQALIVDTAAPWQQGTLGLLATMRPQDLKTATAMVVSPTSAQ